MRLEINLADNSQEAQVLASIVSRDHVSPEEGVRSLLRGIRPPAPTERNFIREGKGMFKDPADAQILDEAVAIALEERRRPSKQTVA